MLTFMFTLLPVEKCDLKWAKYNFTSKLVLYAFPSDIDPWFSWKKNHYQK